LFFWMVTANPTAARSLHRVKINQSCLQQALSLRRARAGCRLPLGFANCVFGEIWGSLT
jgi:hypothetical protein